MRTFFDDAHFAGTGDTTAYTIQLHAVPIGPKRCGNEAVERRPAAMAFCDASGRRHKFS